MLDVFSVFPQKYILLLDSRKILYVPQIVYHTISSQQSAEPSRAMASGSWQVAGGSAGVGSAAVHTNQTLGAMHYLID